MEKENGGARDGKSHTSQTVRRTDRYKKRSRRKRGPRKPWHRRPLYLVFAVLVLGAAIAAGAYGLWTTGNLHLPAGSADAGADITNGNGAAVEEPVLTPEQQQVADMPLKEKIGQMIMVGFEGGGISEEITDLIQQKYIGSVVLFERNIESQAQLAGLTNALQALALQAEQPARLMIAIEQEGGKTRRMESIGPFYSEPMIGEMGELAPQVAQQQASFAARDLRQVGINTNLAPVVDVSDGWGSVMDTRSYGTDPELVAEAGTLAVRGYNGASTICSPKHFPGHGSADEDSHDGLPYVYTSRELLDQYELFPFRSVIAEGAPMIMVGHLVVPALDPSEAPATLSKTIMGDLLRRQMGFTGVIITDDLEMGAIADNWGVSEAAVLAIEAGADMVIIAHTYDEQLAAYDALLDAVRSGRISEEQVNASVLRILDMKKKYRLGLS